MITAKIKIKYFFSTKTLSGETIPSAGTRTQAPAHTSVYNYTQFTISFVRQWNRDLLWRKIAG